ncbi:MAG: response regulator [Acidobacteriaceae bacterium]
MIALKEDHRILIVDDEPAIREGLALLLSAQGYSVGTAEHGFDALLQLRSVNPELIVSDLNMPQMSGFELLSVLRRRFPEILVIAMSGAYESGEHVPGGVIADAFYAKGLQHPQDLVLTVAEVLRNKNERAMNHHRQSAPVWIPRNGHDSHGVPFIVLTCPECLRSFPLSVLHENVQEIQQTPCLFCQTPVRFIIDFSVSVASPAAHAVEMADAAPLAFLPCKSGAIRSLAVAAGKRRTGTNVGEGI